VTTYHLLIESGPQKKRTFATVVNLPGCVFNGPTTGETIAGAEGAIREYLRFLARHGERVDADEVIEVVVDRHTIDSKWVGFGLEVESDIAPLSREELEQQLQWATWMRDELLEVLDEVSDEEFGRKPAKGRPIRQITEHIFGAEYGYVRRFGKIEGVKGPGNVETMTRDELMAWMGYVRGCEFDRLRALTDTELSEVDEAGARVKTVRRYMRHVLDHQWEHLVEIRSRLAGAG
jgi:uncharacterized damage-inducible protein DinB/predicted RNase H-like HicB family nuclease